MRLNRSIATAAYLLAAGLLAIPLLEGVLSVLPARPGAAAWRFGAVGILSRGLVTSLLGLLIAVAVGLWMQDRWAVRASSVVGGVASVLCLAAAGLLAFDFLEVRGTVQPDAQLGAHLAAAAAVVKLLLASTFGALVGWGGWKVGSAAAAVDTDGAASSRVVMASSSTKQRSRGEPEAPSPGVVRQAPRGAAGDTVVPDRRLAE